MAEEIRQPDGDIAAGDWTSTPLWSKIDEGSSSPDGTYIVCPNNSSSTGECSVQDPSDEGTYTAVEVRAYVRKNAAGGNQRGLDGDIRVNTGLQGQKTFQADLTENFVQYTQSWSGLNFTQSEMNSLQVLFISTGTTGGNPANRREVHVDYLELLLTYTTVTYYHGLKVQGVGELALCDVGSHPLRIRQGGTTYGIELVDTSDPNASAIRIKTPGGIKAIRKYT